MEKDFLYPLRKIHGLIVEYSADLDGKRPLLTFLKFPFGKKAYVIGSPVYNNLGDSAILISEITFLKKSGLHYDRVKEITFSEYYADRQIFKRWISKKDLICGLGGGNIGNQWVWEEKLRYDVLSDFPDNPVIIFPQTVFFVDNEKRETDEEKSRKYYNHREKMTLVAREKKSEDIMRDLYPDCSVLLTPDIVLSMTMSDFGVLKQPRKGVLFCCRSDAEKSVDEEVWKKLKELTSSYNLEHKCSDMYADCDITKENRLSCVQRKMLEFCRAELVITDRLHGMVFSVITGTPCIVFGNYNHKIKGTYDWISYLPYIRYVSTFEEAAESVPTLLQMKDCHYDNTPLKVFFDELEEVVKEKCRR